MDMDEPRAITVKYDNISLSSLLSSDQFADQIPDRLHNIIRVDWVIYCAVIKGEDIQVNLMVPAGKHTCKWPKHTKSLFYSFSLQICRES